MYKQSCQRLKAQIGLGASGVRCSTRRVPHECEAQHLNRVYSRIVGFMAVFFVTLNRIE